MYAVSISTFYIVIIIPLLQSEGISIYVHHYEGELTKEQHVIHVLVVLFVVTAARNRGGEC